MGARRRVIGILACIMALMIVSGIATPQDWRNASSAPVGLAPDPAVVPEPVVQVYAARAWGWRGLFGVHTWIAAKSENARAYTVYEVIGWRLRWNDSALSIRERAPDARWFGNAPELLAEKRGEGAGELIPRIDRAARAYPYAGEYAVWPGPNSNTFTAYVLRAERGGRPALAVRPRGLHRERRRRPRSQRARTHFRNQPVRPGAQAAGFRAARAGARDGFEGD